MSKTARLEQGRFVLNLAKDAPEMFDVKRIEGRRWNPALRHWSTPASWRAWRKLEALGFVMLEYGGGRDFLRWLEEDCPVDPIHDAGLFPFQQDGVARLLRHDRIGLFDDMGLGKTIQGATWGMASNNAKLVIAPKVILLNWKVELIARGVAPESIGIRVPNFHEHQWVLVNPEYLPKFSAEEMEYDLVVDEAHLYANVKTQRTKLTLKLAEKATRVLLMTGTPPSQPIKLWPFFLMLGLRVPKEFFPYALRYCGAEHTDFGWNFNGATHLDELAEELLPSTLRRLKADVLDDLPEKLYTAILADPGKKGDEKALSLLDDEILTLVSKGHSLGGALGVGAVQRLRVAVSTAKCATTAEFVAARVPAKHLIFCEFRDTMDTLAGSLASDGVRVRQLHGDIVDRADVERWFGTEEADVLLCQYAVAGLGLNLQAATTVVIHDLPWTPAQLDQAIDRAHRIGQHDSVHVVTVLSRSRVEGLMLEGLREGRKLTDAVYPRENTA